jgi:hypothetical protein
MLPPTLAEMTAWSVEEIEAAVADKLPPGWRLSSTRIGPLHATIRDEKGSVVWTHESLDARLLALDAFGWLLLREAPRPEGGPWVPRQHELTQRVVTADAKAFEDPLDLDPAELDAVYSPGPGKPEHGG